MKYIDVPCAPFLTITRPLPKDSNLTTLQSAICIFGEYSSKDFSPTIYDLSVFMSPIVLSFGDFSTTSWHLAGNIFARLASKYCALNWRLCLSFETSRKLFLCSSWFWSKLCSKFRSARSTFSTRSFSRAISARRLNFVLFWDCILVKLYIFWVIFRARSWSWNEINYSVMISVQTRKIYYRSVLSNRFTNACQHDHSADDLSENAPRINGQAVLLILWKN